jgi:hypothetical protein
MNAHWSKIFIEFQIQMDSGALSAREFAEAAGIEAEEEMIPTPITPVWSVFQYPRRRASVPNLSSPSLNCSFILKRPKTLSLYIPHPMTTLSEENMEPRSPIYQVAEKGRFTVIKEKSAHSRPHVLDRFSQVNGHSRFQDERKCSIDSGISLHSDKQ